MKRIVINGAMNSTKQSQVNISLIFNYLKDKGASNRARIAEDLGLSIPAVSRAVETLEDKGRIVPMDTSDGSTRKGTPVYKINSRYGFIVAVDLFQNYAKALVTDYSGKVKTRVSGFHLESSSDIVQELYALIDLCIKQFVSSQTEPCGSIEAIGVGVPAVINRSTGNLQIAYYEGMEQIRFKEILKRHYQVPVFIENICSLSAFAEKKERKSFSKQTLIFVEIGNGIGSGILLEGKLYRGNGFAGEIGFSHTGQDHVAFLGRKKGYLEKKASLAALRHNIVYELKCGVTSTLVPVYQKNPDLITPEIIFRHAADGDLICRNGISEMVNYIAVMLHNIIVFLNPEVIIIGGDICFLPEIKVLFINPVIDFLSESLPFTVPDIEASSLGSDSGILGAAALAIESLLMEEFPY